MNFRPVQFAATLLAAALWPAAAALADSGADLDLLPVPGGHFVMGDAGGEPDEAPRRVTVAPFRLMRREVTAGLFARFVEGSGYRTDPERSGFGYVWNGRWRREPGADWRHPEGPGEAAPGADHPVVQVSSRDAMAFCRWHGFRLPREEEWEFAARGRDGRRYPWGNHAPGQEGGSLANFGAVACCAADQTDGYRRTAPAGSFPGGASPFGLLDMAGNVWEWTGSPFPGRPGQVALRGGGWGNNPYCLRAAYRHGNPPGIGLDMVGFRCAADTEP